MSTPKARAKAAWPPWLAMISGSVMVNTLPNRQPENKGHYACGANAPPAYLCDSPDMAIQTHYIREWRRFRDMTQEQLAERIGIDKGYLSKIENGKRRYDQPFLEAAAEVLQCSPADLIMRNPGDPDGLWSIYDQLKPAQRIQLVEIAKALKRTGVEG